MYEHGSLPRARQVGLLKEAVGEELLLYDQNSHTAHCLSPIAACIWRYCNGERSITELAQLSGANSSLVADALQELSEKDLLVAEPELTQGAVSGESRREAIGRVARYGVAATAGSLIVSATAATPAMASSSSHPCEGVVGGTHSCCACTEGFCETTPGIIEPKECAEKCEKLKTTQIEYTRQGRCTPP
jgi:hypothetical protein